MKGHMSLPQFYRCFSSEVAYGEFIVPYVWVLTNRKSHYRRCKLQLIDAIKWFQPLCKNLRKRNCPLGQQDIGRFSQTFLDLQEAEPSNIFLNRAFGYWKITVECSLELTVDLAEERREQFFNACMNE